MANNRSPLSYTGRKYGAVGKIGDLELSNDFSVTDDGVVSLESTSAAETFPTDAGTAVPASSAVTLAGGTGISTSASGATATVTLDEDYLRAATGTITAAEVKALAATQKTLVAAPGAGKVAIFEKLVLKLNYGSEVFTESTYNLAVKYTNASGVAVSDTIETTGFIDQSADTITVGMAVKDAIVAASSAENQELVLDNTGGGEIGGNASNDSTVTFECWYRVATL